jgi:hypothetical protein
VTYSTCFVVCCLLFVVCCLLFVVGCLRDVTKMIDWCTVVLM